ncbi:hypothetical protein D3C73_1384870 [compost metagenome]
MLNQPGKRGNQQAKQRHGRNGLNNIQYGKYRPLARRREGAPDAQRDANHQRWQHGSEQDSQMLRQRIVEDILTIGILFEQRKVVEHPGQQQRNGDDGNVHMQ